MLYLLISSSPVIVSSSSQDDKFFVSLSTFSFCPPFSSHLRVFASYNFLSLVRTLSDKKHMHLTYTLISMSALSYSLSEPPRLRFGSEKTFFLSLFLSSLLFLSDPTHSHKKISEETFYHSLHLTTTKSFHSRIIKVAA